MVRNKTHQIWKLKIKVDLYSLMCKIYKLIIVKFTNGCLIHRLKLNFTHYMVNFTCTQNMLIVHNSMYNLLTEG